MLRHIVRRCAAGVLVLVLTLLLTTGLFLAGPFDPARVMCGERCTPDRYDGIKASLHLDRPVTRQLSESVTGLFHAREVPVGDGTVHCPAPCLGVSYDR